MNYPRIVSGLVHPSDFSGLTLQKSHVNHWGELTHLNDSWVVHHQVGSSGTNGTNGWIIPWFLDRNQPAFQLFQGDIQYLMDTTIVVLLFITYWSALLSRGFFGWMIHFITSFIILSQQPPATHPFPTHRASGGRSLCPGRHIGLGGVTWRCHEELTSKGYPAW